MFEINKVFNNLNYQSYFEINNLSDLFKELNFKDDHETQDVYMNVNPDNQTPYLPEFDDLVRIHFLVSHFKSLKVLEFGVGYSTRVIAHALKQNELMVSDKLEGIRTDKKFILHSVDSSKKYITLTKNQINKDLLKHTVFHYSKVKTVLVNNKITTQYKKLPNFRPDFIYIDGPSQWDGITGNINGLNTKHLDRFPISSDLIILEYFLTPGTIIYIDGRTTNARFLINNFQRSWDYHHFVDEDVHLFFLNEQPLGKYNKKHLKFIFEN